MSPTDLKIAYAGSAEFSLNVLSELWINRFLLTDVFTQPDKPTGRGRVLTPTPVKLFSEDKKIRCHTFKKLSFEEQAQILELNRPDFFIIVAYGLMIPDWLIDWPKVACVNIHASLLPQWRGASPIQSAILNNDKDEIQDAIGDMVVVLTSIAKFEDLNIEKCIESAYNVISKRTGKMVNGTFVKDE